jgi:peptidase E
MPNVDDLAGLVLDQDVVWVEGGSVANLLALWRLHGLDEVFRQAWTAGVVLAGVSAGSICWHTGGTTDSFGPDLRPVTNGLGFLPFANGVHYDAETQRRPKFHQFVAEGILPGGYATDNGAGLLYRGTALAEALAEVPGQAAYQVSLVDGEVREERLDTRLLPGA